MKSFIWIVLLATAYKCVNSIENMPEEMTTAESDVKMSAAQTKELSALEAILFYVPPPIKSQFYGTNLTEAEAIAVVQQIPQIFRDQIASAGVDDATLLSNILSKSQSNASAPTFPFFNAQQSSISETAQTTQSAATSSTSANLDAIENIDTLLSMFPPHIQAQFARTDSTPEERDHLIKAVPPHVRERVRRAGVQPNDLVTALQIRAQFRSPHGGTQSSASYPALHSKHSLSTPSPLTLADLNDKQLAFVRETYEVFPASVHGQMARTDLPQGGGEGVLGTMISPQVRVQGKAIGLEGLDLIAVLQAHAQAQAQAQAVTTD